MSGSLDIGDGSSAQGWWHSTAPALEAEGGYGAASSGGGGEALVGDRGLRRRDSVRWRQDGPTRGTHVRPCCSPEMKETWWLASAAATRLHDDNSMRPMLGNDSGGSGRKAPTVRGGGCRLRRRHATVEMESVATRQLELL
jgi:hypothetical protein